MPLLPEPRAIGGHIVEGCAILMTEVRGKVEKEEMEEWWTRQSGKKKKKKGDVGVENEKEKQEGERMESFFCVVHGFD